MSTEPPPPPPGRSAWPLAFAAVGIVAVVTGGALYVFRSLRGLPSDVVREGKEVVRGLQAVAQAFREGTITTSFASYATEVSGSNYLQFATLKQMEVFERREQLTILWGQLPLPDVVVEARAPVEYTYYLDLNKEWRFNLEEKRLDVITPPIEFNRPAIDVSALQFTVREGSVFRDENVVRARLQQGLTALAERRAREHVPIVRELGRRKTAEFVEKWLGARFEDGRDYRVRVAFADELPPAPTALPRVPGD
jgi:hypothetical protein